MVASAITILTVPLIALYELTNEPRPEVVAVVAPAPAGQVSARGELAGSEVDPGDAANLGQATTDAAQVALVGADQLTTTTSSTTSTTSTTTAPPPTTAPASTAPTPATDPPPPPTSVARPPSTEAPSTAPPPPTTAVPTTTTTTPTTTTAPRTTTTEPEGELGGSPIAPFPYRSGWPSVDRWHQLAGCEAGGSWDTDTGNGYYGGLQFALGSWEAVGGVGYPHQASPAEQIYRANLLWELQGWNAWPGCSRQLGWL